MNVHLKMMNNWQRANFQKCINFRIDVPLLQFSSLKKSASLVVEESSWKASTVCKSLPAALIHIGMYSCTHTRLWPHLDLIDGKVSRTLVGDLVLSTSMVEPWRVYSLIVNIFRVLD